MAGVTSSVVLMVGAPRSGKRSLLEGLIRSLDPEGAAHSDREGSSDVAAGYRLSEDQSGPVAVASMPGDTPQELERGKVFIEQAAATFIAQSAVINTKYYNAKVTFWRQHGSLSIPALRAADLERLEGIIVVFNLLEEDSFDEAKQWANFVESKEACSFRLCVGSRVDLLPLDRDSEDYSSGDVSRPGNVRTEGAREEQATEAEKADAAAALELVYGRRGRCLEWCLDNGFEYVEADCRDFERGGETREKEGIPRVVEALKSNVWAGVEYRTASRPSALLSASAVHRRGGEHDAGYKAAPASHGLEGGDHGGGGVSLDQGEVSEYLEGFVDVGEGDDVGYGALDSDGEGGSSGSQGVEELGEGTASPGLAPGYVALSGGPDDVAGISGTGVAGKADHDSRGCIESGHVQLQARWERADEKPIAGLNAVEGQGPSRGIRSPDSVGGAVRSRDESGQLNLQEDTHLDGGSTTDDRGSAQCSRAPRQAYDVEAGANPGADEGADSVVDRSDVARDVVVSRDESRAAGSTQGRASGGDKEDKAILSAAAAVASSAPSGLGVDDAEESEMEFLMAEVLKARELGDSVPHEERRARAANVAMRLAALLGDDGESSGDD